MRTHPRVSRPDSGYTLVEAMVAVGIMALFLTGIGTAVLGVQSAFVEGQIVADLNLRAQRAMERIVALTDQAVTSDGLFSPLRPATGIDSHCLRFRLTQWIDPATGAVTYDDARRVYVYGPDPGAGPNAGLIIGRGPDLGQIHAAGSGRDGLLGTTDDNTSVAIGDIPYVELLIPNTFAPRAGDMFTADLSSSPYARLITFTIRINARDRSGDFVLPQDLVLTERVSLRQ